MEIIYNIDKKFMDAFSFQQFKKGIVYKKSPYLVQTEYDNQNLILNTFTCEIISMSNENFNSPTDEEFRWLVQHWYYFPEYADPNTLLYLLKERVDLVTKPFRSPMLEKAIITTTTVCNAKCYYCYEAGYKLNTMTKETALDTAKYIEKFYSDTINLTWFGGEPLCNPEAIRTIVNYLRSKNIDFNSTMISNGYLLNTIPISEMKDVWNLRSVQITLDGTKEIYLKSKCYRNNDQNAFERVLDNIEMLLENGIGVALRTHVRYDNYEDLKELITEYLIPRFHKYKKFSIYLRELFEGIGTPPLALTEEQRNMVAENIIKLDRLITEYGYGDRKKGAFNGLPTTHCMADRTACNVINPNGFLTPCEHFLDEEFTGDIHHGVTVPNAVDKWRISGNSYEECKTCFYAPLCNLIKHCPVDSLCHDAKRTLMHYKSTQRIIGAYETYKKQKARK